ncbi:hypothetical protein WUBG_16828, partial [Wuchereria bancrofti]
FLYFVVESGLLAWIIQNALSISGVSPDLHFCPPCKFNFLNLDFRKAATLVLISSLGHVTPDRLSFSYNYGCNMQFLE